MAAGDICVPRRDAGDVSGVPDGRDRRPRRLARSRRRGAARRPPVRAGRARGLRLDVRPPTGDGSRTSPVRWSATTSTPAVGANGYFGYFGEAAHGPDGWYSFDAGDSGWHVVVLNSVCSRRRVRRGITAAGVAARRPGGDERHVHRSPPGTTPAGRRASTAATRRCNRSGRPWPIGAPTSSSPATTTTTSGSSRRTATSCRSSSGPAGAASTRSSDGRRERGGAVAAGFGVLDLELPAGTYTATFRPIAGFDFSDASTRSC